MRLTEFYHILAAVVVMTAAASFAFVLKGQWSFIASVLLFSTIVILVSVFARKIVAYMLDSDVEHEIWMMNRWGYKEHQYFDTKIPTGIVLPLMFSLFSAGVVKFLAFMTYETKVLKRRAAKRFGFYSYSEMSEWHNALIGAAGIVAVLLVTIITYFLPANFEYLARISAYFALSNLIPISKLDGAQIFYGSRVLWSTIATIAAIFAIYALIL